MLARDPRRLCAANRRETLCIEWSRGRAAASHSIRDALIFARVRVYPRAISFLSLNERKLEHYCSQTCKHDCSPSTVRIVLVGGGGVFNERTWRTAKGFWEWIVKCWLKTRVKRDRNYYQVDEDDWIKGFLRIYVAGVIVYCSLGLGFYCRVIRTCKCECRTAIFAVHFYWSSSEWFI